MIAGEMVTRALKLAGLDGTGTAPTAALMQDGLATLNEMLFAWANDGIDLGHSTVVQADTLIVPDAYLKGIRFNLAVELADEISAAALPDQVRITADTEKTFIRAQLFEIDDLTVDSAILPLRVVYDHETGV